MSFAIITIDTLDDLKDYSKVQTGKARDKLLKKEEGMPSEGIGHDLMKIWEKSDFGCQAAHVGEAFHALTLAIGGQDVTFSSRKKKGPEYTKFECIVPTANNNSHSYPLGVASIMHSTSRGVKPNGDGGNSMGSDWRYATDAEIDELFAGFPPTKAEDILDRFRS